MTARAGIEEKRDTTWLFYGYLVLLTFEWLGLQNDLPFLKILRFTTLLGYGLVIAAIARCGVGDLFRRPQARIFVTFIVFTVMSLAWAVVTEHAFNAIRPLVDFTVFFVLTVTLIDRPKRIVQVALTFVLIVTALVARNLSVLGDAMRASAFAAGPFLGDGNDFAWGMVIALPIVGYLTLGQRSFLLRAAGAFGAVICLMGVVGTASRGSSLGLAGALLFYLLFVSRHKLRTALSIAVLALGVLFLAPSGYMDRMKSIAAYQEDSSAQSRLTLWRAAFDMSLDYPLGVGAGNFSSAYGRFYSPVGDRAEGGSEVMWAPGRWLNAHSIYFKTLGEYGMLGLLLVVSLIVINVRSSLEMRARCLMQGARAAIPAEWPGLVAMSTVGFAICGIFLGGFSYPHMFLLSGLVVANSRMVEQETAVTSRRTRAGPGRQARPGYRRGSEASR
ncbi:MAG: O-antigen ligase family protein [Steroidobacteraceae bacterium]